MIKRKDSIGTTNDLDNSLAKMFGEAFVVGTPVVDFYRTGLANVDRALGGGIARGRVVEIFGEPSGGKTSLALHMTKELTKQGLLVIFFDLESSLAGPYLESFDFDPDYFKLIQPIKAPISAEQIFSGIEKYCQTVDNLGMVVIDSIPCLITEGEAEAHSDERAATYAAVASFLSKELKHLVPKLACNNTTLLCINRQTTVMGARVPMKDTGGGWHLKYYASQRIGIARMKRPDWDTSERVTVQIRTEKNKVGSPFRQAQFDIIFGVGLDKGSALVQECLANGYLKQKGSWISFEPALKPALLHIGIDGDNLAQGAERAAKALTENPALFDLLYNLSVNEAEREGEFDAAHPVVNATF